MFGGSNTGGGLFGGGQNNTQANAGGGLFGGGQNNTQANAGGGLFGGGQNNTQANAGGGLFGAAKPAATGGGLFGGSTTAAPSGGGLFGGASTTAPVGGGIFGNNATASTGGGLFGVKPAAGPSGGLFSGMTNQGQNLTQQVKRPTVQQTIATYPELEGSFKHIVAGLEKVENQVMAKIRSDTKEVEQMTTKLNSKLSQLLYSTNELRRNTQNIKREFNDEVVPAVKKTIQVGNVLNSVVQRSGVMPSMSGQQSIQLSVNQPLSVPNPIYSDLIEDLERRFVDHRQVVADLQQSSAYAKGEADKGGADPKMIIDVLTAQNRRYQTLKTLLEHSLLQN